MMSKAELARRPASRRSRSTVEAGKTCRLDTKRKILHALGLRVSDKDSVFGDRSVDHLLATHSSDALSGGN
jgi:hypothetical protein